MIGLIQATTIPMLKLGRNQEALDFVMTNVRQFPPEGDHDKMYVQWMLADCYKVLKRYDQAEKHYLEMFKLEKKQNLIEPNIYKAIGQFYVERFKYKLAEPYLRKLDTNASTRGGVQFQAHLYFLLFKIDSAAGHDHSAMRYLMKNKKFDDSIYNQTKTAEIQKLQIQYETEKKESALKIKDQNIRILTDKEKLQQASLDKAFFIRNLTVIGIILLVIIAGLLYRQYRRKQQTNLIITHKNELLEHLLKEKEWLLKEVHHRVKNNLHMVISLLESQAMYLENDALKAMESSQHRIFSMSLIHQKLYQSDEVKTIDMSVYLPEFVNYLRDSFDVGKYIHFNLEVDPVQLSAAQAIPLALVLNEAVTNSIKYAFPGNRQGEITIRMQQIGENIELVIMDNGVGMARAKGNADIDSLGLKLMRGLTEEIRGQILFENSNGTTITIKFKIDLLVENYPSLN